MIEFVNGTIDFVGPEFVVIDVNGVGYQIYCPNPFVFQSKQQQKVKVYTYHYVREDVSALYGFMTRDEKRLFTKLIGVSGIGPKGALAILASGEPEQVISAIENEDEKFLTKFPGVGKKTARQMILDLKGKFADIISEGAVEQLQDDSTNVGALGEMEEAKEALRVLGYADREINKVMPRLSKETLSTDQYVKRALQMLLNGR